MTCFHLIVLAISLILLPGLSNAKDCSTEENLPGFVEKFSIKNVELTFVGTIHLMPEKYKKNYSNRVNCLGEFDAVLVEITDAPLACQSCLSVVNVPIIRQYALTTLQEDDQKLLSNLLKSSGYIGLPPNDIIEAGLYLQFNFLLKAIGRNPFNPDDFIEQTSRSTGSTIYSLETAARQTSAFYADSKTGQVAHLRWLMQGMQQQNIDSKVFEAYDQFFSSNFDLMEKELEEECDFLAKLGSESCNSLYLRNIEMAKSVIVTAENGRHKRLLILVGVDHLLGNKSIQQYIKKLVIQP